MRFTLRILGIPVLSFDVEELVYEENEVVSVETETDVDDVPYGFSLPPVEA